MREGEKKIRLQALLAREGETKLYKKTITHKVERYCISTKGAGDQRGGRGVVRVLPGQTEKGFKTNVCKAEMQCLASLGLSG